MKSVAEHPQTQGQYLRRLQSIEAIPNGLHAIVELVSYIDAGDLRKPVIISQEPLAEQVIFTNTPNQPGDSAKRAAAMASPLAATTQLIITMLSEQIVRVQLGTPEWLTRPRDFGMLIPGALDGFTTSAISSPSASASLAEDEEAVTLTMGALTIRLERDPFALQIGPVRTALDDRNVHGLLCTPPPGYVTTERGPEAQLTWALTSQERIYGLGERFTRLDHRGEHVTLWNTDAWGTTTAASYKNVPFLHTSEGYGIFFHTPAPVELRLGTPSQRAAVAQVGEPGLDCFIILGAPGDGRYGGHGGGTEDHGNAFRVLPWTFYDLRGAASTEHGGTVAILEAYTRLTGRATMPPRWAFGVWLSRCRYQTRAEVEAVAARARAEGIPTDVLHIDPAWLAQPGLNCDFQVNEAAFPDLPGMIRGLREQGFKISLWELPYVTVASPLYADAAARGFFLKDAQGEPIPADFGGPTPDSRPRAVVDFTNLEAKRWWQDLHRPLLQAGVEIFKTDFGEGVPLEARAQNGMTGYELRNLFPLLYNAAVHEVITQEKARPGLVWGRSGWAGTQRYPAQWGGDPKTDAWSMQGSLRGGLNMALSAPGLWSHDIGGFYGPPPSPMLYARWAAFGLLSPLARAHGTTPREPWEFGPEALATFRRYARLRMRLNQYLYDTAWEAHTQGIPMLRPLMMGFPDDPNVASIDDQYMLGPDLLVAPLFSEAPGAVDRRFYLPEGFIPVTLTDDDSLSIDQSGHARPGAWCVRPEEHIVLLSRASGIIPLAPVREYHNDAPPDEITLLCDAWGQGEAEPSPLRMTMLHWDETGAATRVVMQKNADGKMALTIAGERSIHWSVQDARTGAVTDLGEMAAGEVELP